MSHRLKNSDFRPFLGVLDGKVRDSGAYVGEGIGVYFGIISSVESIPGGRMRVLEMERIGFVVWIG